VAIIEFRKQVLRGARDLQRGIEPAAARAADAYLLRGGSMVTPRVSFAEAMTTRFGNPLGRADDLDRSRGRS
jgi:hypothetical protein